MRNSFNNEKSCLSLLQFIDIPIHYWLINWSFMVIYYYLSSYMIIYLFLLSSHNHLLYLQI